MMSAEQESWKALATLARKSVESLRDRAMDLILKEKNYAYAKMPLADLRAMTNSGVSASIDDLEEEAPHHYADRFGKNALQRVRAGVTLHDVQMAVTLAETILHDFFLEKLTDHEKRLYAVERCHAVFLVTRNVMFEFYVRAAEVVLREQLDMVRLLSTPIMPIYEGVLVLPLVGPIDARRGEQIMESLLAAIAKARASVIIIDVTGVPGLDAGGAACLTQVARASRLLGASVVIVGIGPQIAQTMGTELANLGGAATLANLATGIEYALSRRGLVIQERRGA